MPQVTFTALRLCASRPSSWIGGLLLLSAWPALSLVSRPLIEDRSTYNQAIFYELVFVSAAIGVLRGIALLAGLSATLSRQDSGPTLTTQLLVLSILGLVHALIAAAPAIWTRQTQSADFSLDSGLRLALLLSILAGSGSLLLRHERLAASAPWLLGAAIVLAVATLPHPIPLRSLGLTTAALYSAAWLLDHPPGRNA